MRIEHGDQRVSCFLVFEQIRTILMKMTECELLSSVCGGENH